MTSGLKTMTNGLKTMTSGLKKGARVNADKGFFSAENKAMLQEKGLKNGLI